MPNFLLAYTGNPTMPATEEEGATVTAAWGAWMGRVGEALRDPGNPTGGAKTVGTDGSVRDGGAGGITGYSIVSAVDMDSALALAKDCPHLASGGDVEVYETFDVM